MNNKLLLVSGNGRNSGKTTVMCNIIRKFSSDTEIYAVKIAPHFHKIDDDAKILFSCEDVIIIEEHKQTQKDSSLYLQAGAQKSFYIQAKDASLNIVWGLLQGYISEKALVICESGGLRSVVEPSVFIFTKAKVNSDKKTHEKCADLVISHEDHEYVDLINTTNKEWNINNSYMIHYKEALELLKKNIETKATESVDLVNALGRILAEDVVSDINMPPFDKSAMDGYACRKQDIGNDLRVIEMIPAGKTPEKAIGKNECSKIMTGAPVPEGANCVFMIEDSEQVRDDFVRCANKDTKLNICYLGEDIKKNDTVLQAGTKLSSGHFPILASVGCVKPKIYKTPEVSVIVTGSEVVEADAFPGASQIRNSNGFQVVAQLAELNIKAHYKGIVSDVESDLKNAIESEFENSDVLILTGGVSKGDLDLVPQIFQDLGLKRIVDNVSIQPGKPLKAFQKNGKVCFALSGNPVSSYLQFILLVKPYLNELMGNAESDSTITLTIGFDYKRKKSLRTGFIPVKIDKNGAVQKVDFNGSAHIQSFAFADAFAEIPEGVLELTKGDKIDVRLI